MINRGCSEPLFQDLIQDFAQSIHFASNSEIPAMAHALKHSPSSDQVKQSNRNMPAQIMNIEDDMISEMESDEYINYVERGMNDFLKTQSYETISTQYVDMSHKKIENFVCWSEHRSRICIDTSAPSSVIGLPQLRRIMRLHDRSRQPGLPSNRTLQFGDTIAPSIGMIEVMIDTPHNVELIHAVKDIVDVNILPLLIHDDMDGHGMLADSVSNNLWKRTVLSWKPLRLRDEWSVPLRRDQHHLYAKMPVLRHSFYTASR